MMHVNNRIKLFNGFGKLWRNMTKKDIEIYYTTAQDLREFQF